MCFCLLPGQICKYQIYHTGNRSTFSRNMPG
nr:MAG TPA: hypothetical protein [Caudoviricetes sp.]